MPRQYNALVTTIDAERFRILLLYLFIYYQLPYNLIKRPEFRELLSYVQPSINKFFMGRNAITRWIAKEFQKGKKTLKDLLLRAKSRVHISFDMWTSPAGVLILGICSHFLDEQYEFKHPLLALRFLVGQYTSVVMAEMVQSVMVEYEIREKWGVYMADNTDNCDTCVAELVRRLRPIEPSTARRSRCYAHIVNLAAKAFIYGKSAEGFVAQAEEVVALSDQEADTVQEEMRLWRTRRGAFGRFHNIVKHIKSSTLRRQRFEEIIKMVVVQQRTERERLERERLEQPMDAANMAAAGIDAEGQCTKTALYHIRLYTKPNRVNRIFRTNCVRRR